MDLDRALGWSAFAEQARDLAGEVAALVERYRFALLGTVRRDGSPRISAVETHLVGHDLALVLIPRTRKASDVGRDPRVVLQSPIVDAASPGAEYKLRGAVEVVESGERREAIASAVEARSGWRPRNEWLFLAVLVADATHTVWDEDGTALMKRWSASGGGVESRRLELDMELGGYRLR